MPRKAQKGRKGKKAPRKAPRRKAATRTSGTLATLRRQAQVVIKQLRHAGRRQVAAIEKQMAALEQQRRTILNEIGSAVGLGGSRPASTGRGPARRAAGRGRGGKRTRIDWNKVYAKLPRGSFSASDVRRIVPSVAPGTLSQRLTAWVKAKKLKRTGSRRGTRYTRA